MKNIIILILLFILGFMVGKYILVPVIEKEKKCSQDQVIYKGNKDSIELGDKWNIMKIEINEEGHRTFTAVQNIKVSK